MNYPNVFKLNLSLALLLLQILEINSFSHFIVQTLIKTFNVIKQTKPHLLEIFKEDFLLIVTVY